MKQSEQLTANKGGRVRRRLIVTHFLFELRAQESAE